MFIGVSINACRIMYIYILYHIYLYFYDPLQLINFNSRSITHHLISRHVSLLKNNSKNLKKLLHATSSFSIEL
jgi:hypothetical protein